MELPTKATYICSAFLGHAIQHELVHEGKTIQLVSTLGNRNRDELLSVIDDNGQDLRPTMPKKKVVELTNLMVYSLPMDVYDMVERSGELLFKSDGL